MPIITASRFIACDAQSASLYHPGVDSIKRMAVAAVRGFKGSVGIVETGLVGLREKNQVLKAVIVLDAVNVMNMLIMLKRTPKVLGHKQHLFRNVAAFIGVWVARHLNVQVSTVGISPTFPTMMFRARLKRHTRVVYPHIWRTASDNPYCGNDG